MDVDCYKLADEALGQRESVSQKLHNVFNGCVSKDTESLPPLLASVPAWHEKNAEDELVLNWFCRQLRRSLLHLEPRIKALTVSLQETHPPALTLRLDAVLWNDDERLALELSYQNGRWC